MSKPRPTQAGITYPIQPPDLPCGLLITAIRSVTCRCLWAEVNLLNITSINVQNPQQVKDGMVNYVMAQRGVDKAGAEAYIETYIRTYQNDFFCSNLFYMASSECLVINRGTIDLNIYIK